MPNNEAPMGSPSSTPKVRVFTSGYCLILLLIPLWTFFCIDCIAALADRAHVEKIRQEKTPPTGVDGVDLVGGAGFEPATPAV